MKAKLTITIVLPLVSLAMVLKIMMIIKDPWPRETRPVNLGCEGHLVATVVGAGAVGVRMAGMRDGVCGRLLLMPTHRLMGDVERFRWWWRVYSAGPGNDRDYVLIIVYRINCCVKNYD